MKTVYSRLRSIACAMVALLISVAEINAQSAATQPAGGQAVRVYVGTYTDGKSKGIYLYDFDVKTGALRAVGLAGKADNPTFLALAPDGRHLYAADEISRFHDKPGGAVSAFAVDLQDGKLTLLNQQPSGGSGPCFVSIDPSGRNALVANYGSGAVAALPIQPGGQLSEPASIDQHTGTGPNAKRQEGPHAHSIFCDASGLSVFSADLGTDKLYVYRLDAEKGRLTPSEPPAVSFKPGSGPRHGAIHPSGKYLCVTNELNSTLTTLKMDFSQGAWSELQTISTLPVQFQGTNYPADVHFHPNGKFVYSSNRGHDSIAIFAMNGDTGRLTSVGHASTRGKWPRNFGIDPSGAWLIVANQQSDSLCVFRIDRQTGLLTPVGEPMEVAAPACVLFAPR